MARLIGYIANRADRLRDAFQHERDAIAGLPADQRGAWGIGFYQGDEVLHKKQPAPNVASFPVSSASFFSICSASFIHVVREQMMKVERSNFTTRRKSPTIVQSRAHSTLYGLDHFFVFHLHFVFFSQNRDAGLRAVGIRDDKLGDNGENLRRPAEDHGVIALNHE